MIAKFHLTIYLFYFLYFVCRDFDGDMLWVYNTLLGALTFWLLFLLIIVTAMLPDFTLKVCRALNITPATIFPGYKRSMGKKFIHNGQRTETTYL